MDYTNSFTQGLVLIASLGFLVAVYYTYRLSEETKGEKYWAFFLIAALGLGVHEWISIFIDAHLVARNSAIILGEAGAIIGALSLAYASFGLYSYMKKVREKLQEKGR